MTISLNEDCWDYVFSHLRNDHRALYNSLLVSKVFFRRAVPWLYRRPMIEFKDQLSETQMQTLDSFLFSQATHHRHHRYRPQETPLPTKTFLSSSPSSSTTAPLLPTSSSATTTLHIPLPNHSTHYYDFVQEMPDHPYIQFLSYPHPCQQIANQSFENRLQYITLFGPKIKTLIVGTSQIDLMENCFPLLKNLIEIEFWMQSSSRKEQLEGICKAIEIHKRLFSNQLEYVSCLNPDSGGQRLMPWDVKTALVIRDAMNKRFHMGGGNRDDDEDNNDGKNVEGWKRKWGFRELNVMLPTISNGEPHPTEQQNGDDYGTSDDIEKEIQNILTVLQDVDLPTKLRSVFISCSKRDQDMDQSWISPLSVFLSRCRNLDLIFIGCCSSELLSWAVAERNAFDAIVAAGVSRGGGGGGGGIDGCLDGFSGTTEFSSPLLAQWKKISVRPHFDSGSENVSKLWRSVVRGFGHCVQDFYFAPDIIGIRSYSHSQLEDLSILDTDRLTCLETLYIKCSRFGRFSSLATPKLKSLTFLVPMDKLEEGEEEQDQSFDNQENNEMENENDMTENNGTLEEVKSHGGSDGNSNFGKTWPRPRWNLPSSLKSLQIYDEAISFQGLEQTIGHLDQLEYLDVRTNSGNEKTRQEYLFIEKRSQEAYNPAMLFPNGNIGDVASVDGSGSGVGDEGTTTLYGRPGWSLPRLSKVHMMGYFAEHVNMNILFFGPNIKELRILQAGRWIETNVTGFFQRARTWSMTFPNLELFQSDSRVELHPDDLSCLLGFSSTVCGCSSGDGGGVGSVPIDENSLISSSTNAHNCGGEMQQGMMFPSLYNAHFSQNRSTCEHQGFEGFIKVLEGLSMLESQKNVSDQRHLVFSLGWLEGIQKRQWLEWVERNEMKFETFPEPPSTGFCFFGPLSDTTFFYFQRKWHSVCE